MPPLFSELTQISSSFQDIEVFKIIVDTRQAARFCVLNYTFVQKVLTQSHALFIIWNIFYKFMWFLFFFVFQRNSERLVFISENASKACGGSPCLQATWCCLHSHFPQWFHSFLSLMWSLAPWKQVSLSQLLCASSSIPPATMPAPTAESWGWRVGGGVWGTSWITSLHTLPILKPKAQQLARKLYHQSQITSKKMGFMHMSETDCSLSDTPG